MASNQKVVVIEVCGGYETLQTQIQAGLAALNPTPSALGQVSISVSGAPPRFIVVYSYIPTSTASVGVANLTNVASAATGTSTPCTTVMLQADADNSADLLIGNATTQAIRLVAGQFLELPETDVANIYARMLSGTGKLNYWAKG